MAVGRLLRVLGAGFGVAVGVGISIGAGILRAPADVAAALPDRGLIAAIWIAGGVYALLGAMAVAEVATLVARSGGWYPIARRAYGPFVGFLVGWCDYVLSAGSIAALALLLGDNAVVLRPALEPFRMVVSAGVIVVLAAIQWTGVRATGRAQLVTTAIKTLGLLALVIACLAHPGTPAGAGATPAAVPRGMALVTACAMALQGVIWTYDGWYSAIYVGEEMRDPARDIARSLYGTVAFVIVVYLVTNFAFLHVLSIPTLAASKVPASTAAAVVVGGEAERVVAAIVVLSLIGALNATLLGGSRVLFALGRDGLSWRGAAGANAGGTPAAALAITVFIAFLFLLSGTFEKVIASLSILLVAVHATMFMAVFVLRAKEPEAVRPVRTPGHPVTTALAITAALAFIVANVLGAPGDALLALVVVSVSYPAYRLAARYLQVG